MPTETTLAVTPLGKAEAYDGSRVFVFIVDRRGEKAALVHFASLLDLRVVLHRADWPAAEISEVCRQVKRQWEIDRLREYQAEMSAPRAPSTPKSPWGVRLALLLGAAVVVWMIQRT